MALRSGFTKLSYQPNFGVNGTASDIEGPSEKPSVSYTYAATNFFLRLPPETAFSMGTVSVHAAGADWRYESSAVIAGMPSLFPIARQDKPSCSLSLTTSLRRKIRFGRPTTFPAVRNAAVQTGQTHSQ
jgi:hypothetical protein